MAPAAPVSGTKTKKQLADEKAKLKELRVYTRQLLKERNELKEQLDGEKNSCASQSEADESRMEREEALRMAHDKLKKEHEKVVEKLQEAELAAAETSAAQEDAEGVAVSAALEPLYDELCDARGT